MAARVPLAVVILAAGEGTRMRSATHKVLHQAAGRPLLEHVLRAVAPLEPERTVVVVGHGAEAIRARFKDAGVAFVTQDFSSGYGTGHALMQTEGALRGFTGDLLVLNGDGPLLRSRTLERLYEAHAGRSGMTLLTCNVRDPTGLGRIVRASDGSVAKIVEEKDATDEERRLREINPGIYLFDAHVYDLARNLSTDNEAGEYYITDLPGLYLEAGHGVRAYLAPDEREVLGVNNRKELAQAERILRDRIREGWLLAGVTMLAPEGTFIDDTVSLAPDVVLEPGVMLAGKTQVGEGARVGAYAHLTDCTVEPGARVAPHTVLEGAVV